MLKVKITKTKILQNSLQLSHFLFQFFTNQRKATAPSVVHVKIICDLFFILVILAFGSAVIINILW